MPPGWPRRLAVATITIGLMMSVLSNSMTNLALPYIAQDLHISAESSIWIVNASQIALMVTLLPVAALADIVGYRHVYRFGLALFCAGLARLRLRAVAALADRCAHLPGAGRRGHHVGPAGAGARDLSAQHAGPRAGLQHHRGRDLARRRPVDRRGAAVDHLVADPVRRLRAARHHLLRALRALPAAHHAHPPPVRRDLGHDVGPHLRPADLRHRRHGARPSAAGDRHRAHPGGRAGHAVRMAPEDARRSDDADRRLQAADLLAVDHRRHAAPSRRRAWPSSACPSTSIPCWAGAPATPASC